MTLNVKDRFKSGTARGSGCRPNTVSCFKVNVNVTLSARVVPYWSVSSFEYTVTNINWTFAEHDKVSCQKPPLSAKWYII